LACLASAAEQPLLADSQRQTLAGPGQQALAARSGAVAARRRLDFRRHLAIAVDLALENREST